MFTVPAERNNATEVATSIKARSVADRVLNPHRAPIVDSASTCLCVSETFSLIIRNYMQTLTDAKLLNIN